MKRLTWILPVLALLATITTPAGWQLLPHWGIVHPPPFGGLVLLVVLAFMALAVLWPDNKPPSGASDQRATDGVYNQDAEIGVSGTDL